MTKDPPPGTAPAERLPERLRAARLAVRTESGRPLTQDEAAQRVGVKTRTWQRWEAGETRASLSLLPDLARALETTPEELLGIGADSPPRSVGDLALEERLRHIEGTQAAILEALEGLRRTLADPRAVLREADALLEEERSERGS